jgi:TIR domain-containing protein
MRHHTFLSYSRYDTRIAEIIFRDLTSANLDVWFADKAMHAGQRIRDEINRAITDAGSFLILISKNSIKSEWVLNELGRGVRPQRRSHQ